MEGGKDSVGLQLTNEEYFKRLPEVDGNNLRRIIGLFEEVMKGNGRKGTLIAVGGTLTKPPPRKDVDLIVILENHEGDPDAKCYANELAFAEADYQILDSLVTNIVKKDPNFRISDKMEPAMDEEFMSPGILKTDGSITVKADKGASIEFIRMRERGPYQKIMIKQARPFCILKQV